MTDLEITAFETKSPVGPLLGVVRGKALVLLAFVGEAREPALRALLRRFPAKATPADEAGGDPAGAMKALRGYFKGDLEALDAVAVDPGGTPFQQRVWKELRKVRAGSTLSYSELAERSGSPLARRAVGAANAFNPIPLFIPCHRVIASDGSLHGYGGGLENKRWLLVHEGALMA